MIVCLLPEEGAQDAPGIRGGGPQKCWEGSEEEEHTQASRRRGHLRQIPEEEGRLGRLTGVGSVPGRGKRPYKGLDTSPRVGNGV